MILIILVILLMSTIVGGAIAAAYIADKAARNVTPPGIGVFLSIWLVLTILGFVWIASANTNHLYDKTLQTHYSVPIEKKNETYFYQNIDGHIIELNTKFPDMNIAEIHVVTIKAGWSMGIYMEEETRASIEKKTVDIEKK